MESTTRISGRSSYHRDTPPPKHQQFEDSQEYISDGYESNDGDDTQNSEHLYSVSIDPGELKKRTQSKPKFNTSNELDESAKDMSAHIPRLESTRTDQKSSKFRTKTVLLLLAFLCLFVLYVFYNYVPQSSEIAKPIANKIKCSFDKLKKKYPKEGDELWKHLKYGNEDILNEHSDKPAVYLFVHHKQHIADYIIRDIALTSSECFGQSSLIHHMDFNAIDVDHDYGHLIETYKNTIREGNVVLIANLNQVNAEAAKALHAICDTVTPLVKKVIIMLSLTADQRHKDEKVIETAEYALRQFWKSKIKPHELEPIIARVTDQVLLLKTED